RVPRLHRRHLRRPRLTQLLDRSPAQVLLVTAPAGFGKTSLACEWLEGRTDVAWYRATSASADLAAFSVGISEAIAPIVPGAGDRLRQRLLVAEPPENAARPMAELLAEDLAEWPLGAWLVLDDYHLVTGSSPVEEFMDWLLTLAPDLRVLVTARRRPAWASARRFLHGEVFELTARQLAMSDAEAAKVLGGRSGETVRRLVAQAQGWPALIALAGLSASAEVPEELVTERLYRYFAEEVLRTQTPQLQRFMLVSSVPSSIGTELGRALGLEDVESTIACLLDDGLLHQAEAGEAAFHPLLRDFLRRKLESDQPEQFAELADRAVAFGRRNARWEEAFDLAVYRAQLDTAAQILAEAAEDLLPAGRIETLEHWLDACGPAAATTPALLVKAEILLRRAKPLDAHGLAQAIADSLDPASPHLSRAWSLAGQTAHFLSQPEVALSCHRAALATATSDAEAATALWGATLAAAELELDEAVDYLQQFERSSRNNLGARLRMAQGRSMVARYSGGFADSWALLRSTLPLVDHANDPHAESSFLAYMSYVSSLRGDYRLGAQLGERAQLMCERYRWAVGVLVSQVVRAYAELGVRNLRAVRAILNDIRKTDLDNLDPYVETSTLIIGTRLAVAEGDLERALACASRTTRGKPTESIAAELLASRAIVEAATGQAPVAASHCLEALRRSRCIEVKHLAA
ncbi:MAG TPA: hypothetical protein VNL92_00335, partial [Dehalococcoidia bacterium]|nr:hypothetical protein [Dehalococcoidia bacterium]